LALTGPLKNERILCSVLVSEDPLHSIRMMSKFSMNNAKVAHNTKNLLKWPKCRFASNNAFLYKLSLIEKTKFLALNTVGKQGLKLKLQQILSGKRSKGKFRKS
jgi:hypothetical protein